MIKKSGIILIFVLLGVLLSSCAVGKNGPEAEFVFRYAENQAEDFPTTLAGEYFAQQVYERTDGRIQIIVYPDEALGDERAVIEQMQFGGIDFSRLNLSPLAELDSRFYLLQLPYLYDSGEHMWRVLDSELGEKYLDMVQDLGLYGLSWVDAGARSFYARTPIYTLEDMAGMRTRVQENRLMERLTESLGAIPQRLRYGMVLSALQTGEIDSAENNIPSYLSMGHYLIAKYFLEDEHTRIPEMMVMSQVTMDKLSEADRAIIYQAAKEAGLYQRKLWLEYEESAREMLVKRGCTMISFSKEAKAAFIQAVSNVYDEFAADEAETIQKIRDMGDAH